MSAACLLTASACRASVSGDPRIVVPTDLSTAAVAACARLVPALPATLAGAARRQTVPVSPLAVAWGRPAITLRCGVGFPRGYTPDAQLLAFDGGHGEVDWFVTRSSTATVLTAVRRAARVELVVPSAYKVDVAMGDVSDVIATTVPKAPA